MSARPFPWLVVLVVALSLLAVLGVGTLVTVALQPPPPSIPDAPLPPLETRGRAVFRARGCIQCHTVTGEPGIGPTMKDYWNTQRPLADGGTVLADETHFRESLREPLAKVTQGYRPAMPAFGHSVAESDIVALIAYIKTLRSPLDLATPPEPTTTTAAGGG